LDRTPLKKVFYRTPKKVPEVSKSVERLSKSQKKDEKIYETFKGSSLGYKLGTFSCEAFFKVP
jgi:hypothetical protein